MTTLEAMRKAAMPPMAELTVSNDLIGDHEALKAAWERDGYWFFRDVLDKEVIGEIRDVYADYLVRLGLADKGGDDCRYNGTDPEGMPIMSNESEMNERRIDRMLHNAPTINAFFAKLFGCDPFWIPFTVHRGYPPVKDKSASRFDFIHADGIYNEGLPFLICWVPLDVIDEDVGGLALIEGVHRKPSLHIREPGSIKANPIRAEDVPEGTWRRTTYRPGDVLLMDLDTPHTGLSNVSDDRFRFSMDTRIMPSDGKTPVLGAISRVSASGVTIIDDAGEERSFAFAEDSFVRGKHGDQMPIADIPARYGTGDEIIVLAEGDRVRVMRPQT